MGYQRGPCLHGAVCREYIRQFGTVGNVFNRKTCIISQSCPICKFYTPKDEWTHKSKDIYF